MESFRKLIAVALCGTVLLSGCSGSNASWVYEQGGTQMSAGVYITGMMEAYGKVWTDVRSNEIPAPKNKDVMNFSVDGQTGQAWITAKAHSLALEYYGTQAKAAQLGVSLTDEEMSSALASAQSVWQGEMAQYVMQYEMYGIPTTAEQYLMRLSQADFEKNGVSLPSLQEYMRGQILKNKLFQTMYGPEGERAVSEDALLRMYNEQYAKASLMSLTKVFAYEGEELTPEQIQKNDESRKLAESYLERAKNGEALEDLQYEYDMINAAEGDEITKNDPEGMINMFPLTGDMGPADEAVKNATPGQPVMAEDDYAFYILNRVDTTQDTEGLEQYKSTILWNAKKDEFETDLAAWGAEASPTVNQSALNRYTPNKLKL